MARPQALQGEKLAQAMQLIKDGLSYKEVARRMEVSVPTLRKYRKLHETGPSKRRGPERVIKDEDLPKLLQRFDEGATWPEMAKEFGASASTLRKRCREAGRDKRNAGRPGVIKGRRVTAQVVQEARQLRAYNLTWKLIERVMGYPARTVRRRVDKAIAAEKAAEGMRAAA